MTIKSYFIPVPEDGKKSNIEIFQEQMKEIIDKFASENKILPKSIEIKWSHRMSQSAFAQNLEISSRLKITYNSFGEIYET